MELDIWVGYIRVREDKTQIIRTIQNAVDDGFIFVAVEFDVSAGKEIIPCKQEKEIRNSRRKINILAEADGDALLLILMGIIKKGIQLVLNFTQLQIEENGLLGRYDPFLLADKQWFADDLFQRGYIFAYGGLGRISAIRSLGKT